MQQYSRRVIGTARLSSVIIPEDNVTCCWTLAGSDFATSSDGSDRATDK
jgi:hypothetical protein